MNCLSMSALVTSVTGFVHGCRDGKSYMIDTHPVTLAPGKGKGVVMIGKENTSGVWLSLCIRLWKRLHHHGVKPDKYQSLAVVKSTSK